MASLVTNIQGYSIHDGPGIRTVVFLKGCGLRCRWCSNPECISALPEIGVFKSLCSLCGKCAEVCPQKALVFEKGQAPRIDRKLCSGCGLCSAACSYGALVLYGKAMKVEEVFDAVKRDKMFYQSSGGGITVSGGEALLHPQPVSELFERCRLAGINTCIETSGCAPEAALSQVLPYTDYVLYDLKLMNSDAHRRYTGQPNEMILSNARAVVESGVEMLFRMPLIPGINDDRQNVNETAAFIRAFDARARRIEIMPYHRLGKGKYESLDLIYSLGELAAQEAEQVEQVSRNFQELGIQCSISK